MDLKTYRTTFLSLAVFPGLGQILHPKNIGIKIRGVIYIILTFTVLFLLIGGLFSDIQNEVNLRLTPMTPPPTFSKLIAMSIEIKNQIYHRQKSRFLWSMFAIIGIWLVSVGDAYVLDKRAHLKASPTINNEAKLET